MKKNEVGLDDKSGYIMKQKLQKWARGAYSVNPFMYKINYICGFEGGEKGPHQPDCGNSCIHCTDARAYPLCVADTVLAQGVRGEQWGHHLVPPPPGVQ